MDLGTIVNTGIEAYQNLQAQKPLLGAMLTAEFTYPTADAISQLVEDKKVDWRKIRYTAAVSPFYGLGIHALMESGDLVGKLVSENPLAKSALGPNLWGNLLNTFFFVNNTVGERTNYSLKELVKNYSEIFKGEKGFTQNLKEKFVDNIPGREYFNSVIATVTEWNVFQYFNYSHVSDEMRTPATLGAAFLWASVLSLWSLRGRRRVVGSES